MKKICFMFILCCFGIYANATIRVGTPIYAPPFIEGYDPVNGVTGFDIDYMRKICDRLSWKCEFIPMSFRKLFSALKEKKIDFAIGSIVITPNQQKNLLFSTPYLISEAGFVLRKDSPINTLKDLDGKRVGAVNGRVYLNYLRKKESDKMTILPYNLFRVLALDLSNGKVDAVCVNYLTALFIKNQHPDEVKVLSEHFKVGEGMGIVTTLANKDKMNQINQAILQFKSDGTFSKLYNYTFEFIIPELKTGAKAH